MGQEVIRNRQPLRALVNGRAGILSCLQPLLSGTATSFVRPPPLAHSFLDAGKTPTCRLPHPRASKVKSVGEEAPRSHAGERRCSETRLLASCLLSPGRPEGHSTLGPVNSPCYSNRTSLLASDLPLPTCDPARPWPSLTASVCSSGKAGNSRVC